MSPMLQPHTTSMLTNCLHLNMNCISVTKADMFNSLLHRRTRTQVEMNHSAKGNPTHKWETILTKASWANVVTQLKTVPTKKKKKSQIHKDSSSLMISSPSTYTGPTRQACWQTACILNMNYISMTKTNMFDSLLHKRTRTQVKVNRSARSTQHTSKKRFSQKPHEQISWPNSRPCLQKKIIPNPQGLELLLNDVGTFNLRGCHGWMTGELRILSSCWIHVCVCIIILGTFYWYLCTYTT